MLERLVAWVLNSYIGEYFDNVNTTQLSIALQKGEVELERLPLKPNAFKHWGLPIDIKAGYVGKVRVKIPVYRFKSDPWLISLEDLYLVAHAIQDFSYDEENEKKLIHDYKMSLLDSLEMKFQSQFERMHESSYYASSYSSWLSTTTSFVTTIVENLQLKIRSIHIRYENQVPDQSHQFACGITIDSLSVQTVNTQNNEPENVPITSSSTMDSIMNKTIQMENMQIYWDNGSQFVGDQSMHELHSSMKTLGTCSIQRDRTLVDHDYVLGSISGLVKMSKNNSEKALRLRQEPRISLNIEIPKFPIQFSELQLKQLLEWLEVSEQQSRLWKHRRYRPKQLLNESPAAWWNYAIDAHLHSFRKQKQQCSWSFLIERARLNTRYVDSYYNYMLQPDSLNAEQRSTKEKVELEYSFEELCILRELVYEKIKSNKVQPCLDNRTASTSWVNGWLFGWYFENVSSGAASQTDNGTRERESLVIEQEIQRSLLELEEELVNTFVSIESDTFWKRDAVLAQIEMNVESASITLLSKAVSTRSPIKSAAPSVLSPILQVEFCFVDMSAQCRPRYGLFEMQLNVGELQVRDALAIQGEAKNRQYLASSEFGDIDKTSRPKTATVQRNSFISSSYPNLHINKSHAATGANYCHTASLPNKVNRVGLGSGTAKSRRRKITVPLVGRMHRNSKKVTFMADEQNDSMQEVKNAANVSHREPYDERKTTKEALVKMSLLFVDKSSPLLEKKYNNINRFISIEFNRLEIHVINQIWGELVNFFKVEKRTRTNSFTNHPAESTSQKNEPNSIGSSGEAVSSMNSKIDITVNQLNLQLHKNENQTLANVRISQFKCFTKSVANETQSNGSLGSLVIEDTTQSGKIYKERLVTTGQQALSFAFFRYRKFSTTKDHDMKLDCKLSTVQYVHSQRFYSELMHFWQHLNSFETPTEIGHELSATSKSSNHFRPQRKPRLILNVSADAPVIVIPINSLCDHVLVADFGKLDIHNRFAFAGTTDTISTVCKKSGIIHSELIDFVVKQKVKGQSSNVVTRATSNVFLLNQKSYRIPSLCLLDVININLTQMDLFKGVMIQESSDDASNCSTSAKQLLKFPSFHIRRLPGKILNNKFELHLQLERNLDSDFNRSVPDVSMKGRFSTVYCTLNPSTYKLIRGILEHNLGETVNLPANLPRFASAKEGIATLLADLPVWTSMAIEVELNNVTLEVVTGNDQTMPELADNCLQPLARIDFISSQLSIEMYTDSSKDIDLVSQEIKVSDTRTTRTWFRRTTRNAFTTILQTIREEHSTKPFQVEIHYRSKPELARLSVLLNNMRLFGIFDWFKAMSDFLVQTFNFDTIGNFNLEVASHFKQLIEYQSQHPAGFELKLNVTDTELVVLENSSVVNSNAVILRGTLALNLATLVDTNSEPFNCSFQRLEVFSCVFGDDRDETSLSIVDPFNFSLTMLPKNRFPACKLISTDETQKLISNHFLSIEISHMNTRLSFNDIVLFARILQSVSVQTESLSGVSQSMNPNRTLVNSPNTFSADFPTLDSCDENCSLALEACEGNLPDAALWLVHNSNLFPKEIGHGEPAAFARPGRFRQFVTNCVNVQINCGTLTLIDDCKDIDIPLFEVSIEKVNCCALRTDHKVLIESEQTLSCDYYNRPLSGWEPLLEPWMNTVQVEADRDAEATPQKLSVTLQSTKTLDLVVTNTFLQLYQNVSKSWVGEYERLIREQSQQRRTNVHSNGMPSNISCTNRANKRRSPFIPFAIRNKTGCKMSFALLHTTSVLKNSIPLSQLADESNNSVIFYNGVQLNLKPVDDEQVVPFSFDTHRTKIRHSDSHLPKSNKIIVRIEGWQEMLPVSVDKVGVYFREAKPKEIRNEPARIVFEITLESNAVKMITVRSALQVSNHLDNSVELLFNTMASNKMLLCPYQTSSIPLKLVRSQMRVRPISRDVTLKESALPIEWEQLRKEGETWAELLRCDVENESQKMKSDVVDQFHVCVQVKRLAFPQDKLLHGSSILSYRPFPGHSIDIFPTLKLCNTLPCDLRYFLANEPIGKQIESGKSALEFADTREELSLSITIDGYVNSSLLVLKPGITKDFAMPIEVVDRKERKLLLTAHIELQACNASAMKITISAQVLLLNHTGLPLVFKQSNSETESSGQFEEHEKARCIVPLLFSFCDFDSKPECMMRLGKSYGRCQWSLPFSLKPTIQVMRVRVDNPDPQRPSQVYEIGIESRRGRNLLCHTQIVTFTPRYQVENQCGHTLLIAQKCCTEISSQNQTPSFVKVMPNSTAAFHWPRTDQDQLMCVQLESDSNYKFNWSGGFRVEPNLSLHINVRDENAGAHLLRVETIQSGATVRVLLNEASSLPPPIRVDNYSEVPLQLQQSDCRFDWQKWTLRKHTHCSYAWDEPEAAPLLTVQAPGGSAAQYDLSVIGDGPNLTYENFVYIAFTSTFESEEEKVAPFGWSSSPTATSPEPSSPAPIVKSIDSRQQLHNVQLVLDVCEGNNTVILNQKEPGRRSQLWRMDSSGRLFHEGSCPPVRSQQVRAQYLEHALVLDVADMVIRPGMSSTLMLRKVNLKRSYTQCWRLTDEGRLCCYHPGLFVQPTGGMAGLKRGSFAMLGPPNRSVFLRNEKGVPCEQAIGWQKMRQGSGMLAVKVIADGPTRVLQISDIQKKPNFLMKSLPNANHEPSATVEFGLFDPYESAATANSANGFMSKRNSPARNAGVIDGTSTKVGSTPLFELRLVVNVNAIGCSVVNHRNEELIYLLMQTVIGEYTLRPEEHLFNCSIRYIQADNQLREAPRSVILCPLRAAAASEHHFPIRSSTLTSSYDSEPTLLPKVEVSQSEPTSPASPNCSSHSTQSSASSSFARLNDLDSGRASSTSYATPDGHLLPIVCLNVRILRTAKLKATFFDQFQLRVGDLCFNLEEELMLLLIEMYLRLAEKSDLDHSLMDELNRANRSLRRKSREIPLYFALLELQLRNVRLSAYTSSHLDSHLRMLKRRHSRLGFGLIRFENAKIELEPFVRTHSLHTSEMWRNAILSHYRSQLSGQRGRIIGSVDWLGSPLGFFYDVIDGFHELADGNFKGMFIITHGMSDSTAKFTSVLSDSLGSVVIDKRHMELRKQLRLENNLHPIKTGLYGFAAGVLGCVTSIFSETYNGIIEDGVQGVLPGLGKGVVGAITKPAVGVLDLANSAATLMRDHSRKQSASLAPSSSHRIITMNRNRLPRQNYSIGGTGSLLPRYDQQQAAGQHFFYSVRVITDRDPNELFSAWTYLKQDKSHALLLTNERLRLLILDASGSLKAYKDLKAMLSVRFENISSIQAQPISRDPTTGKSKMPRRCYLLLRLRDANEITLQGDYSQFNTKFGPGNHALMCDNEAVCEQAIGQVEQAKSEFEERKFCLNSGEQM